MENLYLGIAAIILAWTPSLSSRIVYGALLKDEEAYKLIKINMAKGIRLNPFNLTIINIGHLPYITNHPFSWLSVYHISGIGTIPRWGRSHYLIKQAFKQALLEL